MRLRTMPKRLQAVNKSKVQRRAWIRIDEALRLDLRDLSVHAKLRSVDEL